MNIPSTVLTSLLNCCITTSNFFINCWWMLALVFTSLNFINTSRADSALINTWKHSSRKNFASFSRKWTSSKNRDRVASQFSLLNSSNML